MYCVYRHLDVNKNILYIGKTIRPKTRQMEHSKNKDWFNKVKHIEYMYLNSKAEMDIAEIYLINKYSPKYNKKDNRKDSIELFSFKEMWTDSFSQTNSIHFNKSKDNVIRLDYEYLVYNNKNDIVVAIPKILLNELKKDRFITDRTIDFMEVVFLHINVLLRLNKYVQIDIEKHIELTNYFSISVVSDDKFTIQIPHFKNMIYTGRSNFMYSPKELIDKNLKRINGLLNPHGFIIKRNYDNTRYTWVVEIHRDLYRQIQLKNDVENIFIKKSKVNLQLNKMSKELINNETN